MKNRRTIVLVVALVVAVAVMLGVYLSAKPETSQGGKTITVIVVHKDGTEKVCEIQTDERYLGTVLVAEGVVIGEEGPYGLEINTVYGEVADWNVDQSYWALYIGEEYATTGADGVVIEDGGVYKLVYTIG